MPPNMPLVLTRKSKALLLAAQRQRSAVKTIVKSRRRLTVLASLREKQK